MDVKDFDLGENSKFSLRLENNMYGTFEVLPSEGSRSTSLNLKVLLPETLDYEIPKYRQQILKVIAREKNPPNRESTATVTIQLTDINDNDPMFDETNYTASVSETRPIGYKIIQVQATDADSGKFGEIMYSLEGDNSQEFTINQTSGEIFLAKALDYEEARHIDVLVMATDGAGQRTTSKLRVNVLDYNDQAPIFSLDQYTTYLREKSTTFESTVIVKAHDPEQSQITYRIKSGNTLDNAFEVNHTTGVFSVKRGVVYQEAPVGGKFRVVIEASDNGNPVQTTDAPVIITLLDVNDNHPIFVSPIYAKTISEITPSGTSILEVSAKDADGGMNGEITYRIVSGSQDNFAIDYRTGIIRVSNNGNLDIDRYGTEYNMLVFAEDKGNPQLSGNCTVKITVTNANNKLPFFSRDTYLVNLADNAPAGTLVVRPEAKDPDGNLARLQYRIPIDSYEFKRADGQILLNSNLRTQLTINTLNGNVTTITTLKPENTKQFSFLIIAEDIAAQDPAHQQATATVLVSLFPPTDDYPYFNSPWTLANPTITINMPEEEPIAPRETLVTTLVARDAITNQKLSNYTVVPDSNADGYFRLDRLNGHVYLNKRVDYETLSKKSIGFEVEVNTIRTPVRTSKAYIVLQVQDLNDNNPQFYRPNGYSFEISELMRFPAQVGQVFANDLDSGSFGTVRYSLSGSGHQAFTIDPIMGRINIADGAVLDFEQMKMYNLRVTATDNPNNAGTNNRRQTSVPVNIRVIDFNDVTPHFEESEYTMRTLETVKAQTSIGRVLALDEDGGLNGQIMYYILNRDDKNIFVIDMNSGVISTRVNLIDKARDVPYNLTIRARDQGSPRLFGDVQVKIFIDDLQAFDGRPRFSHPFVGESIWIPEEEEIGYPVTRVRASDADEPIHYRFLNNGNKDHDKFKIDPNTGNVTTTQVLDRETQAVFQLMIFITDSSNPQKANQMHFFVKLSDKNDQIPTFEFCGREIIEPLRSSVMENQPLSTYVTTVEGCDKDEYPNNIVFYHITCGNDGGYFIIEKSTGIVRTAKMIDREATPDFNLCVRITNESMYSGPKDYRRRRAIPLREKRAVLRDHALIHLYILILDEDDNGPRYSHLPNKSFTTGILMTAPNGNPIINVNSYDPDTAVYNTTFYRILSQEFYQNDRDPIQLALFTFNIEPKTGLLTTGLPSYQDYVRGYFVVTVEAYDYKNRKDLARVVIYILNQSQQLKFTFKATKEKVRRIIGLYTAKLSELTASQISSDERSISPATNDEAIVDFTQTDICFQMVRQHRILAFYDAEEILKGKNDPNIAALNRKYNMTNIGLCALNLKTYTWWGKVAFWWVLIAIAVLLIVIVLIMILVVCCLWARYKIYLKRNVTYIVPPEDLTRITKTASPVARSEDVHLHVKKDIKPSGYTTATTKMEISKKSIPRTEL
ncbi:cadherin-23-like [Tubulanus polymorphus]|uniref:cadherin-23-like n=1 Tax=Tubulanus polymorphus TaxID=672921 RepID=UPI003DA4E72C